MNNGDITQYNNGPVASINKNGPKNDFYDRNNLNNIFDELPDDLKGAIASVDSADAINEIAIKYKLHVDQIAILGAETGYVLLGVANPLQFIDTVSSKLSIDRNTASLIVADINEKIFSKVRESLKNIHNPARANKISTPAPIIPNLIKNTETQNLNVPKAKIEILEGKGITIEKKNDTAVLGFSIQKINNNPSDIMGSKMSGSFNIPKSETEKTAGKLMDPYLEQV